MPFSRQPWVIRLLYPQCSEGTLLLSLPSLIISSCKPSCKSQHSRSVRNDLGWLREGGSMSPFSKVLLNGEVMVKRKLASGVLWGLLFRHDMRKYQKSEGAGVEKEEEARGWVLPPGRFYLQPSAMISLVMMATPDGTVRWESGLLREHLTLFSSPFRDFQYKFAFSVRTGRCWCQFDWRIVKDVVRWSWILHSMLIARLQNAKIWIGRTFLLSLKQFRSIFKKSSIFLKNVEQRLYPFYYHQPLFIQWSFPHLQWQV